MKNSAFLFFFFTMLLFTACIYSTENELGDPITSDDKYVELNIRAEIAHSPVSRAADISWDTNDSIGVTAYNNAQMENRYKNVRFQTTGDGNFMSNTPIYFVNNNIVKFRAYYPYSSQGGVLTNNTWAENQTSEGKKTIDYMWAETPDKGIIDKDHPTVVLEFFHKMSQIAITFQQGEGVNLKDFKSYTISGLKLEGTFNPDDGKAMASGTSKDLTLNITGKDGSSTLVSSIILYPQEISSFDVSVTLGNQVYSCKRVNVNNNRLKEGLLYNYTFTITNVGGELKLTNSVITPWYPVVGGSDTLYPIYKN